MSKHRLLRRRSTAQVLSSLAVVGALVAATGLLSVAAPAAPALAGKAPSGGTSCVLVPQVRAFTANQGVGSYPVLARGKETLVRLYLSLPTCAASTSSITLTSASLTVKVPGMPDRTLTAYSPTTGTTAPVLAPHAAGPATDAAADPKFVVPADVLRPTTTERFTATFSAVLGYTAKAGTTTTTGTLNAATLTGSTAPLTAVVEKRTNALRLLVVPMGDATQSYDSQFTDIARATTQNGLTALSRLMPVPDGTSALDGTGGVRYAIAPTLLDVRGLQVDTGDGAGPRFCGTSPNFDVFKGRLAQFLQSWNTANPTTPVDRALGVVADTVSRGSSDACAEGMASVRGPEAWVRVVAPTATAPTPTGSLMAMEIAHTLGLVPTPRDDPYSLYHSPNREADGTAPNRAYNTALRSFLANDRTALTLSGTWNDTTTVFERDDWAFLVCALGGQTSTECTTSGSLGSSNGVGADPTFVLAGTTGGSADDTDVVESYFAAGVPRTLPAPGSPYRLVQLGNNGEVLRDDDVNVAFGAPVHNHDQPHDPAPPEPEPTFTECPDCGGVDAAGHVDATTGVGSFSTAVPFDTAAQRIELRNGSAVLYSRDRGNAPEITSTSTDPGCVDDEVGIFALPEGYCGQSVQVQAVDEAPENLRLDLFYLCGDGATEVRYPIAVGLVPDSTAPGDEGRPSASWNVPIDTTLACAGGRVLAVVNDGFSQARPGADPLLTPFTAVPDVNTVEPYSAPKPPTAAIYGPLDAQEILQHDSIPLLGAGHDPEDGQLLGDALSWALSGPGVSGRNVGTGPHPADLPAPQGSGWTPGDYTLTLTAVDTSDLRHEATVAFVIVPDQDHDNLSAAAEACTAPQGLPDEDPFNAYQDFDRDGIPNADDQTLTGEPCVSAGDYAATFTIDPNPVPVVGAEGRVVTAYLKIPYRSASSVSAQSVRISRIGGRRVNGFENVGWSVNKSGVGVAKFDRGALIRHLQSDERLLDGAVTITVTGSGTHADGTPWDFTGITPLTVK